MSTTPTKLSPSGAFVLHAAADHPDHVATPPEGLPTAARNAVMGSLLRAGLLEEVAPTEEGGPATLRITLAGLAAIGREPTGHMPDQSTAPGLGGTDEAGTAPPARLPLRDACTGLLVAWDAGRDSLALPGAVEALRAALTRRGAGGRPARAPATPRRTREGTKQATVLALLRRPEGATIADVMGATGWQQHTVRGFLAGLKRKGLEITVIDRVRQVGSGKAGAKGSYSVYRVSEAAPAVVEEVQG